MPIRRAVIAYCASVISSVAECTFQVAIFRDREGLLPVLELLETDGELLETDGEHVEKVDMMFC